jgi:TM2 domain-containing membrane protein YozV
MSTDQPQPVNGLKLAAGICGILCGAIGLHKFVLGYWQAGLIMLLVSVCTCGIGAIPMHIVGVVEAVISLTRTDDQFRETYVAPNRKEWF